MKRVYLLFMFLFITSCSSIDYNTEKDKLFINVGSIQVCTKRIMINEKPYNLFEINDNIQKFFIPDNENKIFIKDLPKIWSNLGFTPKLIDNPDTNDFKSMSWINEYYIVIYEEQNIFSNTLHAAELKEILIWTDGSFRFIVDAPESGETLISGHPDINNSRYLKLWKLRKYDTNDYLNNSSLINREIN